MDDTRPIPLIDHVIVNARDALGQAADLWTRMGFHLTPTGHHTLGSSNNLAILGTDYIELLGVQPGSTRTDVLDWPAGLNGLVFKTTDSDALHATLAALDAPVLPPQAFSRPVDMGRGMPDGATPEAAFRTVRIDREASPSGRMFFCHHLTPNLVWHDPWRRHPNGAIGLRGMTIAAQDPTRTAALFATLFGDASLRRTEFGAVLTAGLASIVVATPPDIIAQYGAAAPDLAARPDAMAALTVRTTSLDQAAAALATGHVEAARLGARLIVPASAAGGLTLVFTE